MKKSTYIILLIIAFISCIGCNHKSKSKDRVNIRKENIEDVISEFDFFPLNAGTQVGDILYLDTSGFYNTTKVMLGRKISVKELNKIKKSEYIYHVNPNDKCVVVINDFLNESNLTARLNTQKSIIDKTCTSKKIPIPNFWSIEKASDDTRSYLKPDSEIFILGLKIGFVSNKINPKKSSMPDEIKHGVVGGVVLNMQDTSAIYFVQCW